MTPDEIIAYLQKKVAELSDSLDSLQFSFWKKTGPAPNGISNTDMESTNFATGVSGWRLDADGNLEANNGNFRGDITGATGTFSGTVSVGSLNIPDQTTANSFHVDSQGNAWWGANVASGYTVANAYVLKDGTASFRTPLMGGATLQYQVGDGGIFSFGDGSDSTATFSDQGTAPTGTTKTDNTAGATVFRLDRDVYYTTMTVNATVTLNPNGYRIFCNTLLTVNGTIERSGNAGSNGSNSAGAGGAGGNGGAALADGYLKGSLAGGAGGAGGDNGLDGVAGTNGVATANSLNTNNGKDGGRGADGNGHFGGTGGTGGTTTASNVKLIANWHLATLLDISSTGATVKFNSSGSAGGAGGGAGQAGGAGVGGGGGGGSGSNGGNIAIYAKTITIGAAGIIRAKGGNGGNGGNAAGANGGVGGGGSGGNGGTIVLTYNTLTNSGSVTAAAGTKGTKGSGTGSTTNGTDGNDGAAGLIYQFQLSL